MLLPGIKFVLWHAQIPNCLIVMQGGRTRCLSSFKWGSGSEAKPTPELGQVCIRASLMLNCTFYNAEWNFRSFRLCFPLFHCYLVATAAALVNVKSLKSHAYAVWNLTVIVCSEMEMMLSSSKNELRQSRVELMAAREEARVARSQVDSLQKTVAEYKVVDKRQKAEIEVHFLLLCCLH